MKLKLTDKLSLAQDDEEPGNWYLFKDKDNGYDMRAKDFEKTGCLCFNHGELRRSFIESIGLETDETHKFIIAGQPTLFGKQEFWGILINASS